MRCLLSQDRGKCRSRFNIVRDIRIVDKRITVFVVESTLEVARNSMTYELDSDLRAHDLVFMEDLRQFYLQGQKSGKLPKEPLDRIGDALRSQVEVLKYDAL